MIRPAYLIRCHRERLRVWAVLAARQPGWVQVVHFDHELERFHLVHSSPRASQVLEVAATALKGRQVQAWTDPEPVAVVPLDLRGPGPIRADRHGHNGVAEAVAVMALRPMPVSFLYAKPDQEPERRRIQLEWAAGERFGGRDRDRGDAPRTFRLDRVRRIAPDETAIQVPVWVAGEGYRWGLR